MDGSGSNVEERRHLGFNIAESMDFYPAFLLAELCPAEDCKAEFDCCGIECIDCSTEVEYRRIIQITSEFHHVVGILFEDAAVPILVRFCQNRDDKPYRYALPQPQSSLANSLFRRVART